MFIRTRQLQIKPQSAVKSESFKKCCAPRNSHIGFTLIELMIVVAILGIIAALAAPAFRAWVANTRTRSVAEALQNGLRLAQTEAVRRGLQTQFVLTNSAPINTGVVATGTGRNWIIQTLNPVNGAVADFVQGANLGDVSAVSLVNGDATVTFNSMGRKVAPVGLSIYNLNNPNGDRRLQVNVSIAGSVRMCDPDVARADRPDGCQ